MRATIALDKAYKAKWMIIGPCHETTGQWLRKNLKTWLKEIKNNIFLSNINDALRTIFIRIVFGIVTLIDVE